MSCWSICASYSDINLLEGSENYGYVICGSFPTGILYVWSLRIQICPKKGNFPIILFWGWDWDHQSYSREGSGFLGDYHFTVAFVRNCRCGSQITRFARSLWIPDLFILRDTCMIANKNLGVHKHAVSCGIEVGSATDSNIESCFAVIGSVWICLNDPAARCFQHLGGFQLQGTRACLFKPWWVLPQPAILRHPPA